MSRHQKGSTTVAYVIIEAWINPAECIDCSMCMPVCPVEAIYPGDEVPEDMRHYATKAAGFDYSRLAPGWGVN